MGNNDDKNKKKTKRKMVSSNSTISATTTASTKQSNKSKEAKKKRDVVESTARSTTDEEAVVPRLSLGANKKQKKQKQWNDTEEASVDEAEKKQLVDQEQENIKAEGEGSKPVNLESVAAVKARIRSLIRLLSKKRDTFPEEVVREKEREIEKLEASIDSLKKMREKEAKDREVDKKYRMVKFFERRKIRRSIDNIQKQLSSSSEERKFQLEEQLREKYLNLLYIRHYPKGTKYISLFPKEKPTEEAILTQKKIKEEIQKLQAEGKLPTKIEDDNEEDATEEEDEKQHPNWKGDKSKGASNGGRDGQSGRRQGGQHNSKPSKQSTWQSNKRKSDNPFVPSGGEKRAKQSLSTIREDDFFVT